MLMIQTPYDFYSSVYAWITRCLKISGGKDQYLWSKITSYVQASHSLSNTKSKSLSIFDT